MEKQLNKELCAKNQIWQKVVLCYRQELKSTDANQDTECNSDDPGKNKNENLDYDTDDTLEDCLDNFDEEVEISKEGTFLVGKTSKFGIAVKFNRKFL